MRRRAGRLWGGIRELPGRGKQFAGEAWGEVRGPLYRNAIFIMLSSIIGTGLGFFFWVIVFRVYRPDDAGFAIALVQTLSFLSGIATLGLGVGLIRYLPETDDRPALVNSALSIAGLLGLILSIVFVLGVSLWSPQLSFILESPVYIVAIVLTAMAYAFAPILDQAAIAIRRADLATLRILVFSLVKIPLPLLFVIWFSGPLGGRFGVYLSVSVAFGISVLVTGLVLLPRVIPGFRPRPRLSRRRLRPMFMFSVGNWVATTIGSGAVLLLPILIVNTLGSGGAASAAFFYAAATIAGLLYIIPNATMTSFLAEASHRNAQRRRDERKAILLSLGLLAPGVVGMWYLAGPLLALFADPGYVASGAQPLRILSLASIPVFLNGIFGTRVRIRKQTWPLIAAASVDSSVTLGLGYFLLTSVGLDGLAVAFVAGQAAATPLLWLTAGAPVEAEPLAPTMIPP